MPYQVKYMVGALICIQNKCNIESSGFQVFNSIVVERNQSMLRPPYDCCVNYGLHATDSINERNTKETTIDLIFR